MKNRHANNPTARVQPNPHGTERLGAVLCHEWAHALAWNCLLDRLSEMPGIDPVKFNRTSHDETWGCAYSQVWRAYLGGHLGEG